MKNTIIIPARAGSKRLKNKNFLIFNDKSLMERTITFSKKINNIDQIIVSSDSSEISYLKKKYKDILFLKRPKYLSTDKSLIINTINYLYIVIIFAILVIWTTKMIKHRKDGEEHASS